MKKMNFLLLLFFLVGSPGFISGFLFSSSKIGSLAGDYLTDNCGCTNRLRLCPFLFRSCDQGRYRLLCPVTCDVCKECDAPSPPTVIPTVNPCTFDCADNTSTALCEYVKGRGFCSFTGGACDKTCGVCKQCVIPPASLPPCNPECRDRLPTANCNFYNTRSFCNADSTVYPDVRFLCQRTCGVCRICN